MLKPLQFAALVSIGLGTGATQAQVVLNINIADPNDVIFTATGAFSGADASGTFNFPIQLKGFFTSDPGQDGIAPLSSTLKTDPANQPFNEFFWGRFNPGQTTLLFRNSTQTETFSLSSAAFTGRADVDLSGISGFLPSSGATGDIVASLGGSGSGTIVGTYLVTVPEPADGGLAVAGAALAFAGWRKRRELGAHADGPR
ncbi:MAG TPA: hypothetical protein VMB21_12780 [Candidatus Limnocylindria bacterium]|nr:hypothetical protein [Candidatus Limnocylindria bacterium]